MKMNNSLLVLFAAILLHTPVSATDDYQRNWNVDVMHYRFHLELRDDTDSIDGETDITVRFVTDGISEFSLDLIGRDPGAETGMEISDVSHNGEPVRFSHAEDRITISMASPSSGVWRSRTSPRRRPPWPAPGMAPSPSPAAPCWLSGPASR